MLFALCGVGGGYVDVGDLNSATLLPDKLLPVDGFEVELSFDTFESFDMDLFRALGGGLANMGVRAFKKSV